MTMTKYFPLASLLLVGILLLQQSSHLTAGVMILVLQVIALLIIKWLIKEFRERDAQILIPIMKQFDFFFAFGFTIWIGLGTIGFIDSVVGRVYTFLGTVVFLGLIVSLTTRLYLDSDLLDAYIGKKDKEEDKDDRQR